MLKFLGRGGAFSDEHNSAFFTENNELILLDCPMTAYLKLKNADLHEINRIYILITHTHSDHLGGTALLIDYEFFVGKIPVTVVAPSDEVMDDIKYYLSRLDGCDENWYDITTADKVNRPWIKRAIPTIHSESLVGRCFGYQLNIDGINTVYTGDTATFNTFREYATDGTVIYSEIAAYKSSVHLFADDIVPVFEEYTKRGIKVYLMHTDNEEIIGSKIKNTEIEFAPLWNGNQI